jgi:hypothetical protein
MNAPVMSAKDYTPDVGAVSTVPEVGDALLGFLEPVTFSIITKRQDPRTFEVTEVARSVATLASIQPLKVRELAIKPEGERRWKWLKIYALPDLILQPKDVVAVNGEKFRVMGVKDWAAKGYMYYEIVSDFQVPTGYAD